RTHLSVLRRDDGRRSESETDRVAQGTGTRQQAGTERRATDPRGRGGAARVDVRAVVQRGEDTRRCALETVRGSGEAGETGAGQQAAARLRSRLVVVTLPVAAAPLVRSPPPADHVDREDEDDEKGDEADGRQVEAVRGIVSAIQSTFRILDSVSACD